MANTRSMTLEYDDKTEAVLEELKLFFGVTSKAEAIRRSLAVARSAAKYADEDRTLTLTEPSTSVTVKLAL